MIEEGGRKGESILTGGQVAILGPDGVRQDVGPQRQERLLPRQVAQLLGDDVDGVVVATLDTDRHRNRDVSLSCIYSVRSPGL